MKTIVMVACLAGFLPVAVGQTKVPKRITAAEAKDHVDETVTVCGRAVDARIARYVISGNGKPVEVNLDQPKTSPIFYFVTFAEKTHKPEEIEPMYVGKQVCVTGAVAMSQVVPFIMVTDPGQIKIQK